MDFFGLLGEKLGHSLSPEIHSMILESIRKDGAYKLFEIPSDKLKEFTDGVKLLKIKGFNITIPYKESIIEYLDYVSDEASKIGAVNTVLLKENKLYGYNTDYFGIDVMMKSNNIDVNGKIAVILGTGGACKAMLTYLINNGAKEIFIVSRTPINNSFKALPKNVSLISYEELENKKGDIIINCTPVGMYPNIDNAIIDRNIIKEYDVVIDLIYNPLETKFLRMGREEGKVTVGGLYMLVGQAVKAQEIFQGKDIEHDVIESIYEKLFNKFL